MCERLLAGSEFDGADDSNGSNTDRELLTSQKEPGGDFPIRRRVNPVRDIMGAHRVAGRR